MSQAEALRTQLGNLRREVQWLEVENARLREGQPEAAALIEATSEAGRCRDEAQCLDAELGELRQLMHESQESEAKATGEAEAVRAELEELRGQHEDPRVTQLEGEVERLTERCQQAERDCSKLAEQLELARSQAELDHYRGLEAERRRWEEREQRLVEQLREAEQRYKSGDVATPPTASASGAHTRTPQDSPSESDGAHLTSSSASGGARTGVEGGAAQPGSGSGSGNGSTAESYPTALSAALLAHQLPPISKFSGEDISENGETFRDWIEQLEMVASISKWMTGPSLST